MVLVKEGKFTLYRDKHGTCRAKMYGSGEGFVERPSSVHIGVNEGDAPVRVVAVFFRIVNDGVTRIDKRSGRLLASHTSRKHPRVPVRLVRTATGVDLRGHDRQGKQAAHGEVSGLLHVPPGGSARQGSLATHRERSRP